MDQAPTLLGVSINSLPTPSWTLKMLHVGSVHFTLAVRVKTGQNPKL